MENALVIICTAVAVSIAIWLLNPFEKLLRSLNYLLHGSQTNSAESVRPFEDMPGPTGLPYFGCFHLYLRNSDFKSMTKLWKSFFDQYGPVFKQTVMGNNMVLLNDPQEIETVFKADGKYPMRPTDAVNAFKKYTATRKLPQGIASLQGEEWSRLRKALAPKMLRPKDIRENLENFNTVTRDTIDRMLAVRGSHGWEGEIPDLEQELAKWATESVGTMAFDLRVGLYDNPPNEDTIRMIQATNNVFKYASRLSSGLEGILFKFFSTPSFWKLCQEQDTAIAIARTILEKKMIELKQMADEGQEFAVNEAVPLLTYLLSKAQLTPEEISMNCISMFRAGIETTATGTLWLLYELALNPRVQERLYEEVTSLVGPHGDFTPDSFAKLDYLKACVKEMMRLHPVAPRWARVLTQDVVLAGYQVPAKTTVIYPNILTGRSEKLFKDPLEFKPERWMKDESQEEIHPFAIIPFGLGPRMCIGRRIAETEMYLLTAKVLQRFVLEYHHEPVEMSARLLLVPDRPVRIKFVDRE